MNTDPDGTFFVNGCRIGYGDDEWKTGPAQPGTGERDSLSGRLMHLFQGSPDRVIFVRGEKSLEFRAVAEVIDVARGAGLNRIALMTE